MKYDPIELELNGDDLDFVFVRPYGRHHFYQISGIKNEKDVEWWDEHLSHKMWYTDEVRKETLEALKLLIPKK